VGKGGSNSLAGGSPSAAPAARPGRVSDPGRAFEEVCAAVAAGLRARLPELEASLAGLIEAISDPRDDSAYLGRLPNVRAAVLEYVVEALEASERQEPAVPAAVLGGARSAARSGIALDTLLRRYAAGNALVGDVLVEEAERAGATGTDLRSLLHRQATIFDGLLETVSEEYARETRSRPSTDAGWRHRYVRGLLAGRLPSEEVELGYDLEGCHLGVMVRGDGAEEAMRFLAKRLDRLLLACKPEEEPAWACWLGGRSPLEVGPVLRALENLCPRGLLVGLGEPDMGLSGWRLSHRQAEAALSIAERREQPIVRYADVAVLVSMLRDELGAVSLRRLYLEPLEGGRDGGKTARETLRAYFGSDRNVSSTAAALGVDRRTVANRIRAIEELFGRPLRDFATDLETALRLLD